ncbi:cation diffusion facilitator family transporter [Pseudidiomarina taiwanensis]|uniref:Cation-efflux pump FieF n=1 Tax=Pseudidiomarina taiwanensis TaxID=337250 RepID=A0A432ZFM7_9GAMM|nr:cation diffusion facilitator family transporter [Pseudidiomarina taiwanensis]RUO76709.1 divalent metal cation transporter FieF [Pseudidiomarina taiwanensis]
MTKHRDYAFWVKLATRASVTVALLLIAAKFVAWWYTDSTSMLASLTDSMLDSVASLFTFFAVRYAVVPADNEHRFGHGKAEYLAALVQSALIIGSACLLIFHAATQWWHENPVHVPIYGVYVSLFAIVLTLGLVTLQNLVVRKTGSKAIAADSLHFTSDLLLNTAVILALGLSAYGFIWADSVFALIIAGYLAIGAARIGWDAFHHLLDHELPPEERAQVIAVLDNTPGIRGYHHLRTRAAGPTRFVQAHIELDDHLTLLAAHDITDKAEKDIADLFPETDVILHMDPQSVVPDKADQATPLGPDDETRPLP